MKRLVFLWNLVRDDLFVLWFALRHPDRPLWLVPVTALLALYALAPLNLIFPGVGLIDDGLIVPMVMHLVIQSLPAQLRRRRAH